ncbi:hypothetical protein ABZ737_33730 [Streptomyces sp. NPDC013087]|uniref:hypothetical protein n=1 Tax=Streptomyces sp. NPDC013087 TaxID=3156694 RepID=UPI0033E843DE
MIKVTLDFKYQGTIFATDRVEGILFPNGKVFSFVDGEFEVYNAELTDEPGVMLVDLDNDNSSEKLNENPAMLMDMFMSA